ncbi:hypothetical protein [Hoeflea sp. TYP-13]|uniref:hypothetical protein n=1 Tax=Hoeflea sp. TYP-13 TaxID=3230023 RepID=UPI0034C6A3F1
MRSTILVEMVDKVNSAVTGEYIEKMVKREAARQGNRGLAIKKLCRDYGFTPAQIKHLRGGRAKDPKLSLVRRVQIAFLDHCENQIKALQHEIRIEKAKHEDADLEHLEAEATALAEKVRRARKARL